MNLDRPYRLLSLVLCAGAFGPLVTSAQDTNWPQWRGPDRTGISTETSWSSEGKPEPLWTKQLGLGHSSFSISDGNVYTLGYDAEAETYSLLWRGRVAATRVESLAQVSVEVALAGDELGSVEQVGAPRFVKQTAASPFEGTANIAHDDLASILKSAQLPFQQRDDSPQPKSVPSGAIPGAPWAPATASDAAPPDINPELNTTQTLQPGPAPSSTDDESRE